jgi:hypothetical protein
MSDDKKTKREVLASSVGLLGVSLGVAAASEAIGATAPLTSHQLKLTSMSTQVAIRGATVADLENQTNSSTDPRRAAIMQAALEQIRKAGGEASDFGLSFGLSWKSATPAAG